MWSAALGATMGRFPARRLFGLFHDRERHEPSLLEPARVQVLFQAGAADTGRFELSAFTFIQFSARRHTHALISCC